MSGVALGAGLHGGLQRIGWLDPSLDSELMLWHGPLMAVSFFATLIGLERAVALGARWLYAAPVLSAASGLSLILGVDGQAAAALATLSAFILAVGAAEAFRQEPALYMATLALGVLALAGANLIWLADGLSPVVALWWGGFLLLVIAGERLELSRILRHGALSLGMFVIATGGIIAALLMLPLPEALGVNLLGASILLLSAWLAIFDIARRTIRGSGLTRYMAAALLAGYAWLALAGSMLAFPAEPLAGFGYDAALHCIFVGFAFSMVFAHAPVIFPALTGLDLPYRSTLYLPLLLLHGSLAARILANLMEWFDLRAAAGALNGAAILLFFILQAISAATARAAPAVAFSGESK